jgi:hypothetical protein
VVVSDNRLVTTHRTAEEDLPLQEFQDAMVATTNKLRTDMRGDISSARRSAEASDAFVHALTKMLLVKLPEADQETRKLGQATAKRRCEKPLLPQHRICHLVMTKRVEKGLHSD